MIDVPGVLLGQGEHYVLQVVGDSMIDAGINDGDFAVIQRCENAENGAIVVALVEDREVTLKRIRRRGASIALEPANSAYEIRIFGPHQVKIQGRLVGLMRRYSSRSGTSLITAAAPAASSARARCGSFTV